MGRRSETPSKVELAKGASRALRGTIAATLASDAEKFCEDDAQLLKFHGVYQQDDRDVRSGRSSSTSVAAALPVGPPDTPAIAGESADDARPGKAYSWMARLTLPGGRLRPEQYLALDALAARHGYDSLRLTTRQSIQFHGIARDQLRESLRAVHASLLTTLGACGDVQRNVMCCPLLADGRGRGTGRATAEALARELRPATGAYAEIWLEGESVAALGPEEPFYGETYLPRKFKTGVALDHDNCIDLFSYDAGLLGETEGDRVTRWLLVAGGGMGMSHNRPDTVAMLAEPVGWVATEEGVRAVRTICEIFRDEGNRCDRKQARLKYLVRDRGMDWLRAEFAARFGRGFVAESTRPFTPGTDHLGAIPLDGAGRLSTARATDLPGRVVGFARDGAEPSPSRTAHAQDWSYGIWVPSGRIQDQDLPWKSTLRTIVERFRPEITVTAQQNLLLSGLDPDQIATIEGILRAGGFPLGPELAPLRRAAMACPALPTCGLAIADAERGLPGVLAALETELAMLGIPEARMTVRMTGCPNGCARPYSADLGIVGRKLGVYHLYVGGREANDRIADLFAADVPIAEIVPTLRPLLVRFAAEGTPDESLGEYYQRLRGGSPRRVLSGREVPTASELGLHAVAAPPVSPDAGDEDFAS